MRFKLAVIAVSLFISGCDYQTGTYGPFPPEAGSIGLTLSSNVALASAGDTVAVTAVVRDFSRIIVPAATISWKSSAVGVVTVSGHGATATVTAVDDGTAVITATSEFASNSIVVTVRRRAVSLTVTSPELEILYGNRVQLVATGRDARGGIMTALPGLRFFSNNPSSLAVSATGSAVALFSLNQPRTALVSASLTRDGETVSGALSLTVRVPQPLDLGSIMLSEGVTPFPAPTLAEGATFFTTEGDKINYAATWRELAAPATVLHIHGPAIATAIGDVLVELTLEPLSTVFGSTKGTITAAMIQRQGGRPPISLDSLNTLMLRGNTYVDVHSAAFPGGELRGAIFGPLR